MILEILFLAAFVEGTVEFFSDAVPEKYRAHLKHAAIVLGIAAAYAFKIDAATTLGLQLGGAPWTHYILTGIIVGRGSNYVNDLVGKLRK